MASCWTEKPDTASRVRQRMETAIGWAVNHGYLPDNPAGHAPSKVLPLVMRLNWHHAALHNGQVTGTLALVRDSTAQALSKLGIEFLLPTAARSREVTNADWSEIKQDIRTWEIPISPMKTEHLMGSPYPTRLWSSGCRMGDKWAAGAALS